MPISIPTLRVAVLESLPAAVVASLVVRGAVTGAMDLVQRPLEGLGNLRASLAFSRHDRIFTLDIK